MRAHARFSTLQSLLQLHLFFQSMKSSSPMEAVEARVPAEDAQTRSGRSKNDEAAGRPKRDSSWDKKWQQHLEKNTTEDIPRSTFFARSPRLPGKVNRSVWESRLAQEATEAKRQLPRTPPPINRVFKTSRASTASPKPHHGASIVDYRSTTPPYPSEATTSCQAKAPCPSEVTPPYPSAPSDPTPPYPSEPFDPEPPPPPSGEDLVDQVEPLPPPPVDLHAQNDDYSFQV